MVLVCAALSQRRQVDIWAFMLDGLPSDEEMDRVEGKI